MPKKYKWVSIEEAEKYWQRHYIGYETETEEIYGILVVAPLAPLIPTILGGWRNQMNLIFLIL